jgi:hypothetical protein
MTTIYSSVSLFWGVENAFSHSRMNIRGGGAKITGIIFLNDLLGFVLLQL